MKYLLSTSVKYNIICLCLNSNYKLLNKLIEEELIHDSMFFCVEHFFGKSSTAQVSFGIFSPQRKAPAQISMFLLFKSTLKYSRPICRTRTLQHLTSTCRNWLLFRSVFSLCIATLYFLYKLQKNNTKPLPYIYKQAV